MSDTEDKRISDLYSRIDAQQPSEMMDARIRRMARQQLEKKNKPEPPTSHRWQWVSVAAIMLLSVGVLLRVFEQQPDMIVLEEAADAETAPELNAIIRPALKDEYRAAEPVLSVEAQKSKRALKKEQILTEQSQCAEEALLASRDQQIWLERIKALRAEGNEEKAACLEMLMQQAFAQ